MRLSRIEEEQSDLDRARIGPLRDLATDLYIGYPNCRELADKFYDLLLEEVLGAPAELEVGFL